MIDGQSFFDQRVKNNLITVDNIRKIATGQGDGYTTGCLLDYNYFNNYYKMIAMDLTLFGLGFLGLLSPGGIFSSPLPNFCSRSDNDLKLCGKIVYHEKVQKFFLK